MTSALSPARQRSSGVEPLLSRTTSSPLVYSADTGLAVPLVAIWMVFVAVFMDQLGGQISTPVMPAYAKSFGVSNAQIGYLYSAFQLTGIFGSPLLGHISDRFGRRRVLLLSILGAGLASLGQGFAGSFLQLCVWRAFGGIWGAVMPVAKVYLADVCSPAVMSEYIAYLSSVPGASQTFGPAFGGGLSKFGLNIPLLVDGILSFAIGVLVFFYLPESPSWLRQQGIQAKAKEDTPKVRVPVVVYSMGICQMIFMIGNFGLNSMLPIVLASRFGFDALHVGYTFTCIAICRLIASIWIAVPCMRRYGSKYTCVGGSYWAGAFLVIAVVTQNVYICIGALAISRMGSSARTSSFGAMLAEISNPEIRARMFSVNQSFENFGKLIGPLITGHLADINASTLPLAWCAACFFLCGTAEMFLAPKHVSGRPSGTQSTENAAELDGPVEKGTSEDYAELGRYVGQLLASRHYPWISQKDRVRAMLDKLLPELSCDPDQHRLEIEQLMEYFDTMPDVKPDCLQRSDILP